ncbi:monoacylglycerol lipase ABHD6 [Neltuma alba]|uniref:monoacylglycerol lipase ABHD6 n=1 Tax=Neltuma alba TaxID=207710 RepID=UPI0010A49254|nr:monoacylglycerol lipase ABHD6 [Prosopis alba]
MISPDDDDNKTVMQFWVPTTINPHKPNLILIHGFGGSSRWQFFCQIWHLSRKVNLFVPDLLFFGDSYSGRSDRSDVFQAKCVVQGMKKLGVNRFSVAGISYGGYVTYKIAEMCPKEVEKVVIVSSGICYTEEQKTEHLNKIGRSPLELLVPENPEDLRCLLNLCLHRFDLLQRLPDFILREAIEAVLKENRKEKCEILDYLLNREADSKPGILIQREYIVVLKCVAFSIMLRFDSLLMYVCMKETLIIWGDKDRMFPIKQAYELQRHLEGRAKVQVMKDAGHALNFDSPLAMNNSIISFLQNQ